MRVSERMSRDVRVVTPKATVREAAQAMAEWDTGALADLAHEERETGEALKDIARSGGEH
jgi:hypothetical protein